MAKEKQKMTLNVKRRANVDQMPPAIDSARVEAFAMGAETEKKEKPSAPSPKQKVVRDAFTMPEEDHALFGVIRQKCLSLGIVATKSEILRAGLKYLAEQGDESLEKIIRAVPKIKTGRPADNSRKG
jgi:hypothetical protein